LYATDTVAPKPGGRPEVTLPKESPDLVSAGQATAATGRSIEITRVEVFLLLVPDQQSATVLGLSDNATAVRTTA
jgi:hypothetical protein